MALLDIVLRVITVVVVLHLLGVLVVIGPGRVRRAFRNVQSNFSAVGPTFAALVVVLVANGVIRDVGVELSWLIGLNITGYIHTLEGPLVAHFQSIATPALTAYFGFVYVFGYVFLLTFPLVVYSAHEDPRPLRVVLVAYILNYGVGLVCYVLFVAYGPRNFMPELVEPLLYTSWPQSQLLTSKVNVNTNVFPSLHTSLSVTVALVASQFWRVHRRWTPIAWVLATSITVSTMYLGIHWVSDVVAGILLAVVSVVVASRATAGPDRSRTRRTGVFGGIGAWVKNRTR